MPVCGASLALSMAKGIIETASVDKVASNRDYVEACRWICSKKNARLEERVPSTDHQQLARRSIQNIPRTRQLNEYITC